MTAEEREKMLDLLCDKFVFGLSEEEARQLNELGIDQREAESIERTIAVLGMVDLDAEAEMPASLRSKLQRDADEFFDAHSKAADMIPQRQIVLDAAPARSWFGWMGWAVAAAACVLLAVSLYNRPNDLRAGIPSLPTPTPVQQLTPAQERQKLMESPGPLVRADWGRGKMENVTVTGDVVWSEEKQTGYMRLKGLPKNDPGKETYQLWIVDGAQDPKTPIDGGVFDIDSDGEVIIPIDAKIAVRDPKAFAITIERPGGVVVSKQDRVPTLALVKPA